MKKYRCKDCGEEISRQELENSDKIVCPYCGSYKIEKSENE